MTKLISVITPSYNAAGYIEEAIESVLNQSYKSYEHIIVDGGSTDGTLDILKKYPHLKWISEPDNGQSDAMNKGFGYSKGEIIVYLNADDYFDPDTFSIVIDAFDKEKDADIVVGNLEEKFEDGNTRITGINFKPDLFSMLNWWKPDCYPYNPVSYFYLRRVQECIQFDMKLNYSMDYKFLLDTYVNKFNFIKINSILGTFRLTKGCKTFESNDPQYFRECYDFTRKYWKYCTVQQRINLSIRHYNNLYRITYYIKYPKRSLLHFYRHGINKT